MFTITKRTTLRKVTIIFFPTGMLISCSVVFLLANVERHHNDDSQRRRRRRRRRRPRADGRRGVRLRLRPGTNIIKLFSAVIY
jgi:hypothetical protein